jgi:hypothetical protein
MRCPIARKPVACTTTAQRPVSSRIRVAKTTRPRPAGRKPASVMRSGSRGAATAPQHLWLTRSLFVGEGTRLPDAVPVRIHAV